MRVEVDTMPEPDNARALSQRELILLQGRLMKVRET